MNSGQIVTAVLEEGSPLGSTLDFVVDANAPRGGMKHTFFTPDRKYAVQFFNDRATGTIRTFRIVSAPSSAFIIPPCRSRRGERSAIRKRPRSTSAAGSAGLSR